MGTLIMIVQFLMALSLLIVLHEGGHFFFARLFKTRVEKFYLFFDFLFPFSNVLPFSLFKKKIGETQWGIGWFPLGGYVKIAGMVDESMDKEQLAKPPEPWEFRSKKPWQRLLIMLGGIIVNVLLAFVIYAMVLFVWGEKRLPISEMKNGIMVTDSLVGHEIGFQDGDKIVSVDGKTFKYFDEARAELLFAKTIEVNRNGTLKTIQMPEKWIEKLKDNPVITYAFPTVVSEISKGTGAEKAGLQPKDVIVGIDSLKTPSYTDFKSEIVKHNKQIVNISFMRNGILQSAKVQVSDTGTIGFKPTNDLDDLVKLGLFKVDTRKYGFFESFPAGVSLGVETIQKYWRQLGLIVHFKNGAYKQTGGFASMAKIFGTEWDWLHFWNITAFISIALAIMNLLPIPGLDGGYVVFTLIEMIIGRKVNEKVVEVATTIGLVLLLLLMVLVNGNDIFKMFK